MTARAKPDPRAVLRHRPFLIYWLVRAVTMTATQMQAVAVGWQVYDLTHRPEDLGYVGLVQFLPALGFALFTGQVADHFDRRRVLMTCIAVEALCALALLVMVLTGSARVDLIFLVLALFGTARAFEQPAGASLLPNLVPLDLLPPAIAWNSSAMTTAMIAGPALGGLLYAFGAATVYGTYLVLLAVSLVLLAVLPVPKAAAAGPKKAVDWASLVAGIGFIRRRPVILGAISLDLFAVLLGGATALLPIYARDILQVGPWGLGVLRSAPAAGALVMAVWLAHFPLVRHAGRAMFAGVAVFGLATIIFALSRDPLLSLVALFILGASDMISVNVRQTLVQMATPDAMRGRVGAVNYIFIGTSNQLGEFESGLTAAWFGVVPAAVLGGVGTLVVVALWLWRFPSLARIDDLRDTAAAPAPGD